MQIVLNTHGLSLRVKDRTFHISDGKEYRKISPEQVTSIAITASCTLSSAAVILAAEAGIPLYFLDHIGDVCATLRSPYFESLATLRRKQVYFSDHESASEWIIAAFKDKTQHQIQLLRYLANRKTKSKESLYTAVQELEKDLDKLVGRVQVPDATWSASIMGWEGNQARKYWKVVGETLPEPWAFSGRSRRPAADPFNALINYGYGMLYSKVEQAIFAAGLDPHLGILHVDEYDRPTLAFDLIEPFRPWVDRLVVEHLLLDKVQLDMFESMEGGVFLGSNGKRFFIPAFNEWLATAVRWKNRQMTREAHIFFEAAALAKFINTTFKRPR